VNTLQLVQGVVAWVVLAGVVYLLVRAPKNVPLRAITVLIASWALAYAFGAVATSGATVFGVEPIMSRLVQHVLLLIGAYSLICFYLFSALGSRSARVRAVRQAVPLAVGAAAMTVAAALVPTHLRSAAATLPSGVEGGPVGEPTIAVLYLTVNVYMLYAFAVALLWTRRYSRGAEPRLRRGLRLASTGLLAIEVALALFVTANITRWLGGTPPRPMIVVGIVLVLPGIIIFLIGLIYPAAVTRLAVFRVWRQHRRSYHYLSPLWTALNEQFPQDALSRVPVKPWRDALSLRGVHRRYYRRVIECRDGLVRISPYLPLLREHDNLDSRKIADQLREGLRAYAAGRSVPRRASAVAVPAQDGLDADVTELVALSQALRVRSTAGTS
jgi:hypothetical protein